MRASNDQNLSSLSACAGGTDPIELQIVDDEDISSSETITTPFKPSDIRLTTPPMNLGDLIDMIREGWINFGTDYQRTGNLWDDVKQSRLIESVLLGLRLPAFYFEEISKRQWNIIDGLQRCCVLRNFCVDGSLALSELEFLAKKFNGKHYQDFPFETKRDVRMLPITVNVLEKGTPDAVKYILFKRLNTGGMTLTPQEIRTAMYQGKVVQILNSLAESKSFLEATEGKISSVRQEDKDFVSRFVAFYLQDYETFQPDLESFINLGMAKLRDKLSDSEIEKMREDFDKAMKTAYAVFGPYAFRKRRMSDVKEEKVRRPLNKAYFEVVSSTFAQLTQAQCECLVERKDLFNRHVLELMENESFWISFSGGTGKKDSVNRRYNGFAKAVAATLNNQMEVKGI